MAHTNNTLDLAADIIDVRDIIARFEELEDQLFNGIDGELLTEGSDGYTEAHEDYKMLQKILEEMCGYGGDEQWRGDWYPITLIRESYFTDYIKELIHDCYEMPKEMATGAWPYRHMTIDYEAAADEAKGDYNELEIDGVTYFYR